MNLDLIEKYFNLCKEFNKIPTFEGLKYFRKAFK